MTVKEHSVFYNSPNHTGLCFDLADPSGRGVKELKRLGYNFELITTHFEAYSGDDEVEPYEAFDELSIFGESHEKVQEMKGVLVSLGFTCYPSSEEYAIWTSMENRFDGVIVEQYLPF